MVNGPQTDASAKPDPGVAPFGNFINYYQFNSAEERLRLLPRPRTGATESTTATNDDDDAKLLPTNVWSAAAAHQPATEPYVVLDVGCNAGNFTQLLYEQFLRQHCNDSPATASRPIHVLGIDIDAQLIERARQQNGHPKNVSYLCLDVMSDDALQQIDAYLDSVVPIRSNGNRPPPQRFNAVFCMSVTLWIHLNHGDAGLAEFLRRCSRLCGDAGGLLVIEPQPWKCYGTAVRRQRRAAGGRPFERFDALRWRRDVEERIDECLRGAECGRRRMVWQTVPTKWERRIALYVSDGLD